MNHLLINADLNRMHPGYSTEMLYACLAEEKDGLLPLNAKFTSHVAELVRARAIWHVVNGNVEWVWHPEDVLDATLASFV